MNRIPFSQVLKNASIDLEREYARLYGLFFLQKIQVDQNRITTLREYCANNFISFPFRGTCVSLDDFDDFYGYHFEKVPANCDVDYLISFCEYSYNIVIHSQGMGYAGLGMMDAFCMTQPIHLYLQQVLAVIETVGFISNTDEKGITDFVPKDQAAISVAEIVDPDLSYRVIEYNHHSMKGDLERKRSTILVLADKLEAQQKKLKQINAQLETDLFFLLNNINLRHNNTDPAGGKKYHPTVAEMGKEELESWYDETYQMCLLAFLELDNIDRKEKVGQLKQTI